MSTSSHGPAAATQATVSANDISFLLPTLLNVSADLTGINSKLEDALGKLNRAIAAAQDLDPNYPALALLRSERIRLLRFQRALIETEQNIQDDAVAMEDGFAASHDVAGITPDSLSWLFKKS